MHSPPCKLISSSPMYGHLAVDGEGSDDEEENVNSSMPPDPTNVEALRGVIRSLVMQQAQVKVAPRQLASLSVPYRVSMLTKLIRDALGGNCKTAILVSASASDPGTVASILNFAQGTRKITNRAQVSKKFQQQKALLKAYMRQMNIEAESSESDYDSDETDAPLSQDGSSSSLRYGRRDSRSVLLPMVEQKEDVADPFMAGQINPRGGGISRKQHKLLPGLGMEFDDEWTGSGQYLTFKKVYVGLKKQLKTMAPGTGTYAIFESQLKAAETRLNHAALGVKVGEGYKELDMERAYNKLEAHLNQMEPGDARDALQFRLGAAKNMLDDVTRASGGNGGAESPAENGDLRQTRGETQSLMQRTIFTTLPAQPQPENITDQIAAEDVGDSSDGSADAAEFYHDFWMDVMICMAMEDSGLAIVHPDELSQMKNIHEVPPTAIAFTGSAAADWIVAFTDGIESREQALDIASNLMQYGLTPITEGVTTFMDDDDMIYAIDTEIEDPMSPSSALIVEAGTGTFLIDEGDVISKTGSMPRKEKHSGAAAVSSDHPMLNAIIQRNTNEVKALLEIYGPDVSVIYCTSTTFSFLTRVHRCTPCTRVVLQKCSP